MVGRALCLVMILGGCSGGESADDDDAGGSGGGAGTSMAGSAGSSNAGAGGTFGSQGGSAGSSAGGSAGGSVAGSGGEAAGPCRPMAETPTQNPDAVDLVPDANRTISSIHVVGEELIVKTNRGIERVPKTGGTLELVLDGVDGSLQVAGETAYWMADGNLYSAPVTGTGATATTVSTDIGAMEPNDILLDVDETHAYFWIRAASELHRVELTSGDESLVLADFSPLGFYLHGGYIYFIGDYDDVNRVPTAGGTPERIAQGFDIPWALATDGTRLFVGTYGQIVLDGDRNQVLVETPSAYMEKLAVLGERVLFENDDGLVGWVTTDGSACRGVVQAGLFLWGWDYDATNVYITVDNKVYKIPQ